MSGASEKIFISVKGRNPPPQKKSKTYVWSNYMHCMFLDGAIYPYGNFCVSRVESYNKNYENYTFHEEILACVNGSISETYFAIWYDTVHLKLIIVLHAISILCLCFLFLYTFIENKEKLYG